MDRWAKKPLDYEPGTKWQYSNTGYVIAGRIVEKVSGKPLFEFLQERIFKPLQMTSAHDFDREPLTAGNASGYTSFALGPPRASGVSGAGWLFGAGGLAMTAEDLARWNISIIDRSLLSESSYRALETETLLDERGRDRVRAWCRRRTREPAPEAGPRRRGGRLHRR